MRLHAAVMVCTGDASPITILTLSEEEALHAQKIIRDGRKLLVISEMEWDNCRSSSDEKNTIPEVRVYPSPDEAP